MAHKWECWAGAWVIWIKLPGFQQFSLFLISQFYRQAFVLNPVNAQERLLKAHIWPQLGCSIKTSPSSSLQTDIPKAGAAPSSLTVTRRQPHQAREAQHRQGGGTEQDSETRSSNTALPTLCPLSHHRGGCCWVTPFTGTTTLQGEWPRNLQSHSLGSEKFAHNSELPCCNAFCFPHAHAESGIA